MGKLLEGPVQVVGIGDTHGGSTMGLCPRGFHLDDGAEVKLNPLQEQMLDHWNDFWKRRKAEKIPIVTVFMADMIDNNHHGTAQVWTTDEQLMIESMVKILQPVMSLSTYVLGLRGTPAHAGASGKYDNALCRELGTRQINGHHTAYHLRGAISGVNFNIAHHGPNVGKKIHTFGNAARSFARNIFMLAMARKQTLPDVIMRAHVHKKLHETLRDFDHEYHMIITPAWQFKTEFAHKIDTEDDMADVGGAVSFRAARQFRRRNTSQKHHPPDVARLNDAGSHNALAGIFVFRLTA